MKDKLTLDVFYPHPPERVWKALTDPKALGQWLMPTNFQPMLGARFRFDGLKRGGAQSVEGFVIELEVAKRLTYSWDDGEDDAPGIVSWTLSPVDGGTKLRLEHTPAEASQPYVLIEANLNWKYAMYASLPVMLRLLEAEARKPRAPIVYVQDEPETEPNSESAPKRRAGFRQEEATCC